MKNVSDAQSRLIGAYYLVKDTHDSLSYKDIIQIEKRLQEIMDFIKEGI